MKIGVVALTRGGKSLAYKIQKAYPRGEVEVYLSSSLQTGSGNSGEFIYFNEPLRELFGKLFKNYRFLVCVMAAGIAVRLSAPYLSSKREDPAIAVVDEKGNFVISLLSGHLGGANLLTREIAEKIGAQPVITTATDVCGKPALEMTAEKWNMGVRPVENIKKINWALVNGYKVRVFIEKGLLLPPEFPFEVEEWDGSPDLKQDGPFDTNNKCMEDKNNVPTVIITSRLVPPDSIHSLDSVIFLHPKNIVLGVGCKRGVSAGRILNFVERSFREEGFCLSSLRKVVSVDIKRDEKGLLEAARSLQVPLEFVSLEEIKNFEVQVSRSKYVEEVLGVGSVCEPAALIGAGRGELLWKKKKLQGVTTAAAQVISGWWE
ncbi:MAG: cobalamin biosynthesis protein CbiG [Firmicutes bacterium HGW-Firmicutes-13]|nr:MAG: cobalamin biosynthesis protein CbiG [Firmicutes bacterium HGW-Firmicutes-13]